MLYNEVRPNSFDGIKGQESIVRTLRSQSMMNQFFSLYILNGQYGGGKTTTARVLALAANCEHKDTQGNPCLECEHCKAILSKNCSDYVELDAASNTGVEKARDLINDVGYLPTSLNKKVYIIDEAHMLSKGAFNSLLKTLEEPPEYAMFILCTTDIDAIPLTIRSRAAVCTFAKIPESTIVEHLKRVAAEKYPDISMQEDAFSVIGANSDGSMRNALSLLEQSVAYGQVTAENVMQMMGVANADDVLVMVGKLLDGEVAECVSISRKMISGGRQLVSLTEDILRVLQDVVVLKVSPDTELISGTERYKKNAIILSEKAGIGHISGLIREFMEVRKEIKRNAVETVFICSIVRMCAVEHENSENALSLRIEKLEKELSLLKAQKAAVPGINIMETVNGKTENECVPVDKDTEEIGASENHAISEEMEAGDGQQEQEAVENVQDEPEIQSGIAEQDDDNAIGEKEEPENEQDQEDGLAFSNEDIFGFSDMFGGFSTGAVFTPTTENATVSEKSSKISSDKSVEKGEVSVMKEPENEQDTDFMEEVDNEKKAYAEEQCKGLESLKFDVNTDAQEDLPEKVEADEDEYCCEHKGFAGIKIPVEIDYEQKNDFASYSEELEEEYKVDEVAENDENMSEVAKQTMQDIESIMRNNPAFCSAIEEGSKRQVVGDDVRFISPLKPVCELLQKHFDVFGIRAVAMYDPTQEI